MDSITTSFEIEEVYPGEEAGLFGKAGHLSLERVRQCIVARQRQPIS
jgi:hypothetical protein